MTVLIVGGDYVTSLKHQISTQRHARIEHWSGRETKGFNQRSLPNETRLVVVICDYVSHSLANSVKEKASRSGIPLVFCHRSVNELKHKLLNAH
ncbi:MAG: DUF2325 domain-containing protein [Nitrosomonas sp.]|nr:DUF2325 domain-containing protein [Nitrosomonas sp.]MDP1949606.1 DUF2325 domain-containing protein [Nitrosomonas sp.]